MEQVDPYIACLLDLDLNEAADLTKCDKKAT